jgi:hypothetical protein
MAKQVRSTAARLREWREFLEDFTECHAEGLPGLFGEEPSPAVMKAASYFNLDMTNQIDSDRLLHILADVAFPPTGRQSGSKFWGWERLCLLGAHWREVAGPGVSNSEAAKRIKKRYPDKYQSAGAIRPHIPDARILAGDNDIPAGKTAAPAKMTKAAMLKGKFLKNDIRFQQILRRMELLYSDLENVPRYKRREALKTFTGLMIRADAYVSKKEALLNLLRSTSTDSPAAR